MNTRTDSSDETPQPTDEELTRTLAIVEQLAEDRVLPGTPCVGFPSGLPSDLADDPVLPGTPCDGFPLGFPTKLAELSVE